MDAERARELLLKLPTTEETVQWGGKLVFWAGHKALGGKMFAILDLDSPKIVIAFAAGPERAAELCEREGFQPAPYLARAHWVAAEQWGVLSPGAWGEELLAAHTVVLDKLPLRTRTLLALPKKERVRLIAERKAAQAAEVKGTTPPSPARKRNRTGSKKLF